MVQVHVHLVLPLAFRLFRHGLVRREDGICQLAPGERNQLGVPVQAALGRIDVDVTERVACVWRAVGGWEGGVEELNEGCGGGVGPAC